MALETTDNRIEYAGNGVTTAFSFPNYFLEEADLKVIIRSALGVETLKTLTTHYTVAGEGEEAGGTVTMLSAPAVGESLIIYRDPAILQDKDFVENDSFPAEQAEEAFDRAAMISQRLADRLDRTVRLSDGFVAPFDLTLPADLDDSANKIPLINADGDGFADAADWPDVDGTTAAMAASAAAAAASASAAATSASAAATSASGASTSETNAAGSASAASTSAGAASTSASAAAASAAAAASTLASALWRAVVRKTFADSPYTVTSADNGKLIVVDTTGGAVVINLPSVAAITLPFTLGVQLDAGTNTITVNRNGTDTIDGATSKTISVSGSGAQFLADSTPAPDEWEVIDFGAQSGNLTIDNFSGTGAQTAFVLSVDPGSENNTFVWIEGVYQQKNTYSVAGTTLTFSEAPPTGTSNIEVIIGTTLSIGSPGDSTVTKAKFAGGAPKLTVTASKTGTYSATSNDDIIPCDATGGAFSVNLPAAVSNAGMKVTVIKTDSSTNAVTIDGNASETIDGDLTLILGVQRAWASLVCDGSAWIVFERSAPGKLCYQGTYPNSASNYWSSTSAAFASMTVTGTIPTVTADFTSGITVANAGSNLPGVSFTAPRTGRIKVNFIAAILPGQVLGQVGWSIRVRETNVGTTVGESSGALAKNDGNNHEWPIPITGYLDVTAGTAYNLVLQSAISTGTFYVGAGSTGICLTVNLDYIS